MNAEELLFKDANKEVWLRVLSRPYHLDIAADQPYVCILFVSDDDISTEERISVSKELIDTNCKYAVCAGHLCSLWDDSIDMADLEKWNYDVPDNEFVMTSWHTDETVEEVLYFGLELAKFSYADYPFQKWVILQLGQNDALKREIRKTFAKMYS